MLIFKGVLIFGRDDESTVSAQLSKCKKEASINSLNIKTLYEKEKGIMVS